MPITRESIWYANGQHSDGSRKRIMDLDDTHIINLQIYSLEKDYYELFEVITEEIEIRGIQYMCTGSYVPYVSQRTGEIVENGEY